MGVAQRSHATLTIIMPIVVNSQTTTLAPSATQRQRTDSLTALARETGGGITWMTDNAMLTIPLVRALEEFQASYVLHFAPRGVAPGGVHTLQVTVKGRPQVRARRTYVR